MAPSPTGRFHIGGLRTILYNFALARKSGGTYVLRIEDTDQERFVPEAIDEILEVHDTYGLEPDESIKHGGDYGPYIQSKRLETYQEYAHQLVRGKFAYYCFLTKEETQKLQEKFRAENKKFRSPYRDMKREEALQLVKEGKPYTIRLKVKEGREIEFEDGIQGKMKFNTDEVDDQVLLKQDGFPTYHLAVVIDDHLMKISHVFRGVEWLPSTPKHILLYEAFDWEMPKHFHLPLILDPNGGKLSKRKGATAAMEFIESGYLADAVLNFLMLLGWSSPLERVHGEAEREIFSVEEFVELFETKDINKSSPVFNDEKLNWFNKEYIKMKSIDEFTRLFVHWVEKYASDKSFLEDILADTGLDRKLELVKERVTTLKDVLEQIKFFYVRPVNIDWNIKQLEKIKGKVADVRKDIIELFSSMDSNSTHWTHEKWENGIRSIADKHEIKHGDGFMVLRVATVGGPFSPPLFEALQILGRDEVLKRLKI